MYLYEKQYNIINVYEMKENKEAIKEYRKKEMKKIPEGAEILCATTHYIDDNEITFLNRIHDDAVEVPFNFINGTDLYGRENKLSVSCSSFDEKENLLNKFYDGDFSNSSILKVTFPIYLVNNMYLLLTQNEIKKYKSCIKIMDNIIEIPKSLYTLQMFNKKRFDLIKNEDLSEILALYEISCFDEISLNELVKAEDYGINYKGFCDNLINTIKKEEDIIKKIKPLVK